jgi:hypothetical protein
MTQQRVKLNLDLLRPDHAQEEKKHVTYVEHTAPFPHLRLLGLACKRSGYAPLDGENLECDAVDVRLPQLSVARIRQAAEGHTLRVEELCPGVLLKCQG